MKLNKSKTILYETFKTFTFTYLIINKTYIIECVQGDFS